MENQSELVLDGVICQQCGETVDGMSTGYPRDCFDCINKESKWNDGLIGFDDCPPEGYGDDDFFGLIGEYTE